MNREDAITEVGKPILRPIYWLLFASTITFITSPFIWIWFGWSLFWKLALSGFSGMVIFNAIDNLVKKTVSQVIDQNTELLKQEDQ